MTYENVLEVRSKLVDLEAALGRFMMSMSEQLRTIQIGQLVLDIDVALGLKERSSEPMTPSEFNTYASHFFTWATYHSYDTVNQPVRGRDARLVTGGLDKELTMGSVGDNLSFVNHALKTLGFPHLVTGDKGEHLAPLPNPRTWQAAARAYAQLQAEWPALADPTDDRRPQIIKAGRDLRDTLVQAALSPVLLPRLLDAYGVATRKYGQALDSARQTFQAQHLHRVLGHPEEKIEHTCDIFGAIDQSIGHRPPALSQMHFPRGWALVLDAPANMARGVAPLFLLADFLDPDARRLAVTYSVETQQREEQREVPLPPRERERRRPPKVIDPDRAPSSGGAPA